MIQELYHHVQDGSTISFCTTQNNDGKRAYIRGMSMMLLKAVYAVVPKGRIEKVTIDFCLDAVGANRREDERACKRGYPFSEAGHPHAGRQTIICLSRYDVQK